MSASISARRLRSPYPIVIRAVRGPADLAVVINQDTAGLTAALWHGRARTLQPLDFDHATYATTATPDGRHLLDLDDPTGSEVGHLHAFPIDGGDVVDLTPHLGAYTIRGIDCATDGRTVLVTGADETGFFVLVTTIESPEASRVIFHSPNESWSGILSADAAMVALETTDHNPGVRRFAVTVLDTATGDRLATLSDGPVGPIRPVRFAQEPGDSRLLACTEASGFARPVVWDPVSDTRTDIPLAEVAGDVVPLDWHSATGRVLLVHVDDGIHRLLEHDLTSGTTSGLDHPPGAYFEPDTGSEFPVIWASYYAPDGARRLVCSRWDVPLHILESSGTEAPVVALPPAVVPPATEFTSRMISSRDGTLVQLWVGLPDNASPRRGTILEVHGGPNLATVDRYDALAQAWIDDGWVYAALNYRGSVTFGREFREKYWGRVGEGELDDIAAAVQWLEQQDLACRESLFITGASYGGFLTLLALGRLPDVFAGGLAHVAQADWVAAYPDMHPALQAAWRGFIGSDPNDDPHPWERASPITYVDDVQAPVWLNQGAFDTRTPPRQAQAYADAMRARGKDVRLDFFPGGHMPGGLTALAHDYAVMVDLATRALDGDPWSAP